MIRCGVSQVITTPPFPVVLGGYAFGKSEAVLQDLCAQTVVLEQNGARTAIISLDLLGLSVEQVRKLRNSLKTRFGISNALIHCTHSHSTPTGFDLRGGWGKVDPAYMELLHGRVIEGVRQATEKMFAAKIGVTTTSVDYLTRCSPSRHKDGPIDTELGVIAIRDDEERVRGVVVNFACHPVCLHGYRNLISPDFPGYLREKLKDELPEGAEVAYLSGAFGDIMPADFKGPGKGEAELGRRMGHALAAEVMRVIDSAHATDGSGIRWKSEHVKLPLTPLPPVEQIRSEVNRLEAELKKNTLPREIRDNYQADIEWANEAIEIQQSGRTKSFQEIELLALIVGDLAVLAMPLELYAQVGLIIKQASPFKYTFIAGNSNGAFGYLATRVAYDQGSYTVTSACRRYGMWAFSPDVSDILIGEAGKLLSQMKQQEKAPR